MVECGEFISTLEETVIYCCWELVAKRLKITREKFKKYIIRLSDNLEH